MTNGKEAGLLSLAVLLSAGCGVGSAELAASHAMESEGRDDSTGETESVQQGVGSTTPYYHWSSRTDQLAPAYEACSPNLIKVQAYIQARWGGQSLGCHGNRYVKGQGNSAVWSTHAWGAALDFTANGGWATNFGPLADFLISNSEELGINALHDYRRVAHSDGTFRGRIWKPIIGWKPSNIGDSGTWIHIEVRPDKDTDGRPVEERLGGGGGGGRGGDVGTDGCTSVRRSQTAAYGCACVDGQPNGGWCPGTGCSAAQTQACSGFGAGCVDGRCNGIFAPGVQLHQVGIQELRKLPQRLHQPRLPRRSGRRRRRAQLQRDGDQELRHVRVWL